MSDNEEEIDKTVDSFNEEEEGTNLDEVQEIDEEKTITEVDTEEESKMKNVNKPSFIHSLLAQLIDQVVIGVISILALYLFDILLRLITGYYVSEKVYVLFIIYALFNILYVSIMEGSMGSTLGKNIFGTTVNKKLS